MVNAQEMMTAAPYKTWTPAGVWSPCAVTLHDNEILLHLISPHHLSSSVRSCADSSETAVQWTRWPEIPELYANPLIGSRRVKTYQCVIDTQRRSFTKS